MTSVAAARCRATERHKQEAVQRASNMPLTLPQGDIVSLRRGNSPKAMTSKTLSSLPSGNAKKKLRSSIPAQTAIPHSAFVGISSYLPRVTTTSVLPPTVLESSAPTAESGSCDEALPEVSS